MFGLMTDVRVVLRYFPVLGRAQALRHCLRDAGVAFEDVRVPLSEWPRYREDPSLSGAYRALPTLSWAGVVLAETLPIASFIARRLGQYDAASDEVIARREGLCSTTYIDVLHRLADVIRADLTYPGADCGRAFAVVAPRMWQRVQSLERQVPETGWLGGESPVVADFFVAEAFEVLRYVLGPARDATLSQRVPRLAALARAMRDRPRLAGEFESRPARFTGRPDEDRVVEELRAVDLSSIGL
jgi:glutathione S-transferase